MASNQTLAIQAPYRIQGLSIVLSITLRNGLSNQSIQQSTRIYLSANQFSTEKDIKKRRKSLNFLLRVPRPGVEPGWKWIHWCLRPARLPIPPSGQTFMFAPWNISFYSYPDPGSNRDGSESTGVWDQRVYRFRHLGITNTSLFLDCGCKGTTFFYTSKHFRDFFFKKSNYNMIYYK